MKLGAPGSSVFCSASKGATSEPTSSLSLPDNSSRVPSALPAHRRRANRRNQGCATGVQNGGDT
jgi:hypothetical protein